MSDATAFDRVRPWIGLMLPPLAWVVFEYGSASIMHGACAAVGAWLGPAWGVLSLVACAVAVLVVRPMAAQGAAPRPPVRPWLARIAMFGAGLFALAIGFQTLATLLIPSCAH